MRRDLSVRVSRSASENAWLVPLALFVIAVLVVLGAAMTVMSEQLTDGYGFDFQAYFDAAQRLIATGSPYQPETLAGPFHPGPAGLYLYSPLPALLIVPLTWLGLDLATLSWLGLRIGLLVLTCALLPVPRGIKIASFGVAVISAQFLYDLNLGNVSLIVTFLAVVCWRWLDQPLGAVAIAASMTMRPWMVVIGAWWAVRRRWHAMMWLAIGGAAFFLVSLPFVGLDSWLQYVVVLRHVSNITGVDRNVDFGSTALALGASPQVAVLFLVAGYALAIGAVVASLRRDREISFAVTLMAAVLLSPLFWDHYLTSLLVPAALVASRGQRWAVLLPLLGWLPLTLLPVVAVAGMLLPFAAPNRGVAALQPDARAREPIGEADAGLSGAARA